MEIGNEMGGPRRDHIWIAGGLCWGLVIWEAVAPLKVQAYLSAGVSKPWREPFWTTKLYLNRVNLVREHQVKGFGSGSLSQLSL